MAGPGGGQPIYVLRELCQVGQVRPAPAPEGLAQAEVPAHIEGGSGQTRHAGGDIARQTRRHPAQNQSHQDHLQRGDDDDLERDEQRRKNVVGKGRAGSSTHAKNAGDQNAADQEVGGGGDRKPRDEYVPGSHRCHHQLQQVTSHKERGDHGWKPDDQHQ